MSRCSARVYYRDISRYTGRGANGFEREWTWRSCKRRAAENSGGMCRQHAAKLAPADPSESPSRGKDG